MPRGVYERKLRGPYNNKTSAEERFWTKVNKETGTDCWEFTGCLNEDGYGQIRIDRKMILAHRFSYQLHKGAIPEGMCILHSCDNRKCVRPDHLSVGTHADNMRDMINKNRHNKPKGSDVHNSKLNEDQVKQIKNKINLGIKQTDIAKEYRVSRYAISKIKKGKSWAHVN